MYIICIYTTDIEGKLVFWENKKQKQKSATLKFVFPVQLVLIFYS